MISTENAEEFEQRRAEWHETMLRRQREGKPFSFLGDRDDIACVINGRVITKAEVLEARKERQRQHLERIRRPSSIQLKPCFVWVFFNESWIYHGWWLYISAHRQYWKLSTGRGTCDPIALKVMKLFPTGHLPLRENLYCWMEAFAATHHRPTKKRPKRNGLALAWIKVDGGRLLDIARSKDEIRKPNI